MLEPKVIIHGGFFSESSADASVKKAKQDALAEIVTRARDFLDKHSATETAAYAVSLLEDCELFNAGRGSQIQSDGKIRLSAGLMDGRTQRFSGLVNIEDVKNPIVIAQKLLNEDDRVLSGQQALDYAREQGFPYFDPETHQRRAEYEQKKNKSLGFGTVGCVALDIDGNIAAATSTGGKGFERPGRVSDTPTVAGNYASPLAGVSCTGVGEDIVSGGLAVKIVTRVTDGLSLEDATVRTFDELKPYDGFAGIIAITSRGEMFHYDSHPYMVWAAFDSELSIFR